MKKYLLIAGSAMLLFLSCHKSEIVPENPAPPVQTPLPQEFTRYTINQGEHFCDPGTYTQVKYAEMKFVVRFDSSAIYKTADPANQADINKLYGFSDNNDQHHNFSARFGWCWIDNSLALFAYTYNEGERSSRLVTQIKIGELYQCSIKVNADNYIFSVGESVTSMPRLSKTSQATGYKLFPYFGGDEPAPHPVQIWIKEL